MKKIIIYLLLISVLVLCSCKNNDSSHNNYYIYNGEIKHNFLNTTASKTLVFVDVTKFNEIKSGMTYEQVFDILCDETNWYLSDNCKTYLLNNNKILSFKYENITDLCNYSGDELLDLAKSYMPPNEIIISGNQPKKDSCFAVVVDDGFVFSVDGGFSELSLKNSNIVFQNGNLANEDDLTINSQIIIYYDEILESYPGTIICSEIVILDKLETQRDGSQKTGKTGDGSIKTGDKDRGRFSTQDRAQDRGRFSVLTN